MRLLVVPTRKRLRKSTRAWAVNRQWRWATLGILAGVAACGAVLVPLQGSTSMPAGTAQAAVHPRVATQEAQAAVPDFASIAPADGPEGRLIAAYVALGVGDGRKAFDLAAALVQDHPEFALAQLLYGDLLATRAGIPSSFGTDGKALAPTPADERRLALHEEAVRRLAALRERPPAGKIPAEFALLPASTRHAVAVDTSRSRLYLFTNGPQGLVLERDFYVSLGKQGVAKAIEGDKRTPLGVYWITAALPQVQLDERFGNAALRFNYPNAWDRHSGRTGTGLYLHGVPPSVLTHAPWATDGCVAMANEDVGNLLRTVSVDTTPVVIARELNWVSTAEARQTAAEFRPAYEAWDNARRNADANDLAHWYDSDAIVSTDVQQDTHERDDLSFVAWYGDSTPLMIVTARRKGSRGDAAFRQYWQQRDGRWRILFDGPVSISRGTPVRSASLVAEARPEKKKRKKRSHSERRMANRVADDGSS